MVISRGYEVGMGEYPISLMPFSLSFAAQRENCIFSFR
jgi:hypothetical protein